MNANTNITSIVTTVTATAAANEKLAGNGQQRGGERNWHPRLDVDPVTLLSRPSRLKRIFGGHRKSSSPHALKRRVGGIGGQDELDVGAQVVRRRVQPSRRDRIV
jgi:hypothetical protein